MNLMHPIIKVLLICVNYNSDESAIKFIKSVNTAEKITGKILDLSIVLVDNTNRKSSGSFFLALKNICSKIITIKSSKNVGYFGGVRNGLNGLNILRGKIDYIIVSNVDLELKKDFFSQLFNLSNKKISGIYAPSIISKYRKKDVNPKILKRPNRWRMKFYEKIFSNPNLFIIYAKFLESKNNLLNNLEGLKGEETNQKKSKKIYAPHGSIMVFTKEYFKRGGHFNYPIFLFGEEIFVAEIARLCRLNVYYEPSLIVYDDDHVSTGKIDKKKLSRYHYKAVRFLNKKYF